MSQGGMAERSCRPAFSLPFHGLIVARQVDFSNEVPDQFDFLPAMAAGFVRRMDDNFLYKLIDDGGVSSRIPTYFRTMVAKLSKSALSCSKVSTVSRHILTCSVSSFCSAS